MSERNHKVGDIVEVFGDPVSKLISQGKAKIVCSTYIDDYYQVIFIDDPEAGEVGRFIL